MVGFPDPVAALELWEKYYRELAPEKSVPYPGVHEAIEKIVAAGIKIGVITSRSRDEFEFDRNLNPWRPWLQTVICADAGVCRQGRGGCIAVPLYGRYRNGFPLRSQCRDGFCPGHMERRSRRRPCHLQVFLC